MLPGPWLIGTAGVFGLLIGSFLNVVIWRIPRGESVLSPSHCTSCDAPIRAWQNVPLLSWVLLRGKCANCKTRISRRYPLVELGTAVAFGLVVFWRQADYPHPPAAANDQIAWWLALLAFLWFAAASIALALIDFAHQRLPNAIVLPSIAVVGLLLSLSAVIAGDWSRLISTIGGGAALFVLYLVIALVYPAGIGGGDVKLAPVLGFVLGSIGWSAVAVGTFAGFLLAALLGLALIAARRATRKTGIAFGPWILVGAWIGAIWGPDIFAAYLSLVGLA